jgi:hypothetical protein
MALSLQLPWFKTKKILLLPVLLNGEALQACITASKQPTSCHSATAFLGLVLPLPKPTVNPPGSQIQLSLTPLMHGQADVLKTPSF